MIARPNPCPLLAKHRLDFGVSSENALECFIKDKKNTNLGTATHEPASRVV